MTNTGYIVAALILIIPQLIAIWQNRRIAKKVADVEQSVNGVLAARVKAAEAVGAQSEAERKRNE